MNFKVRNNVRKFNRVSRINKKWINIYWGRKSKNCFFEYLIEDWISSAMVEKYLLKALTIAVGSITVALLSMMGGEQFGHFSETFFIPLQVFFRFLTLSWKTFFKILFTSLSSADKRFLYCLCLFCAWVLIWGIFQFIKFLEVVVFNWY